MEYKRTVMSKGEHVVDMRESARGVLVHDLE